MNMIMVTVSNSNTNTAMGRFLNHKKAWIDQVFKSLDRGMETLSEASKSVDSERHCLDMAICVVASKLIQIEGGMSDMQRMFLLLNLAEITKTSGKEMKYVVENARNKK